MGRICDKCDTESNLIGSGYIEIEEIFEAGYDIIKLFLCRKCLASLKAHLNLKEDESV